MERYWNRSSNSGY